MALPKGLSIIIHIYAIIGGLALGLTIIGISSLVIEGMEYYFSNIFNFLLSESMIMHVLKINFHQTRSLILLSSCLMFVTFLFHIILAEALFHEKPSAFQIGILFHIYSALSSIILWIIGAQTLKMLSLFFLSMNIIKASYLLRIGPKTNSM
jgi:hypothetical protein